MKPVGATSRAYRSHADVPASRPGLTQKLLEIQMMMARVV
ncbi:hypothetical protein ABIE33_004558 [Ensifer sp. 4252]